MICDSTVSRDFKQSEVGEAFNGEKMRRVESCSSMLLRRLHFPIPLARSYQLPSPFSREIAGRFAVSARFSRHNQPKLARQYTTISAASASASATAFTCPQMMSSNCRTDDAGRSSPVVPIPPVNADKVELMRELEATLGSSFSLEPLAPPSKPLIVVISGPSGVGKDAVIKRLHEVRKGIHFVVTATTRAKRPGEVDGHDYYFVTKEQFLSMIEKNELLESALVYGDYKGIPKQQIRDFMSKGFDIVLRVDIQGAATLRSILGNSAIFIFLVAESETALVRRLVARKTETTDTLLVRIGTAREELKHLTEFDYVVVNAEGKLESAVKLVGSIIDAEKARVRQCHADI